VATPETTNVERSLVAMVGTILSCVSNGEGKISK
jgi:hypothetical protein